MKTFGNIDLRKQGRRVDSKEFQPKHLVRSGIDLSQMMGIVSEEIFKSIPTNVSNPNIVKENSVNKVLYDEVLQKMNEFFPFEKKFDLVRFYSDGDTGNKNSIAYWQRTRVERKKVFCSDLVHSSVKGIRPEDLYSIKTNNDFSINEEAVNDFIRKNFTNIACFVVTGGTTDLGIVEKIPESTKALLQGYNIPVHADCAYGGFNIGLQNANPGAKKALMELMEFADSVSIDAHKFIGGGDGLNIVLLRKEKEFS